MSTWPEDNSRSCQGKLHSETDLAADLAGKRNHSLSTPKTRTTDTWPSVAS